MRALFVLVVFVLSLAACQTNDFEKAVSQSLEKQLAVYPKSTLKDIYKNFFQDRYGPGHLVSDTAAAKRYLHRELDSYTQVTGDYLEPLGWQHNFYRVNLSLIKEGKISFDQFFDAFIKSVSHIESMPVPEWKSEWEKIINVLEKSSYLIPGYEKDKKEIAVRLDSGKYVGHHSRLFEDSYQPHYRIMSRDVVEKEIQPLLNR